MEIFAGWQSIFVLMILIAIGFILARKRWFDESTSALFSRLVINITLPAMMLNNVTDYFELEQIREIGFGFFLILLTMAINFGVALASIRLFRIPQGKQGVFACMFSLSNTIFIGLPVNVALFGEAIIPYVLVYFVANTIMLWTVGVYLIRKDAHPETRFTLASLRKVFTPPLISFLVAVLLTILNIPIPSLVLETSRMIGGMTTPLATFYIGIVMESLPVREIRISKPMILVVLGRNIIAPSVVFAIFYSLQFPPLMRNVFVIMSAMPVMTQTVILSRAYDSDQNLAALGAFVTTIISLAAIPIYMMLLS